MRVVSRIVSIIGFMLFAIVMSTLFAIGMMTPEKTKDGNYTDVWKYWTSDAYLCQNFCKCDCNCNNVK